MEFFLLTLFLGVCLGYSLSFYILRKYWSICFRKYMEEVDIQYKKLLKVKENNND